MAVFRPILCYVLMFTICKIGAEFNDCIKPCTCLGQMMDCSNSTLSVPPDLPTWVKELDLSSNKLDGKILKPLNHLAGLTDLKLSYNAFKDIPELPPDLQSMSNLVLSHNDINITNSGMKTLHQFPLLSALDLSNNHITHISGLNFPFHLKELNLNNNGIQKLEGSPFRGLENLLDLRINKNKLKSISASAFTHLKALLNLDLNRNQLTKLESLTFQNLTQLTTLRLRRNNIALLEDGVFWNLNNITTLLLDHNNVANISKSWLYGLDSLHLLNLSHNHIKEMDHECWSFNSKLVELDLSHNQIKMIGKNSLNHLSKLQRLRLNANHISYIEEGAFNHTTDLVELELNGNDLSWAGEEMNGIFNSLIKLEVLSLSENRISSISSHAFRGVSTIRIMNLADNTLLSVQENPWVHMPHLTHLSLNVSTLMCDCNVAWLPEWLRQQPFAFETRPTCAYPFTLQGTPILNVAPENFSCDGIPNPHIIREPQSKMVLLGSNVTLSCHANSSSDEKITFRWKRDNVEVKSSPGMSIKHHVMNSGFKEQTSELHILNASLGDAGIYQCYASNSYGSVHSGKANVSVVVFPKFTKIPEDLQVKTGSIARLPCAAEGLPEPKMSWQKDGGNDFPAARERRMHVMPDDDVFFIVNVKPFDMGVYSCMARNDAGVNITNASLTILETPSFLKLMENKDVRVGQAVVLECLSTGSPRPRLKWQKDGVVLRPSDRYHFTADDELLIIRNTQPEDAGKYECELSNPLGTEKGYSKLTIIPASGSLVINDDMIGIIVIAVVCCAVCTSIVWVAIIYHTRKHMTRASQSSSSNGGAGMSHVEELKMASDHSPVPLLVYGHPGGQIANQMDTDSEHSSSKDSGTGDSKRSHSHEELLPPMDPSLHAKLSENGEECGEDSSDGDNASPAAQRLVGPVRSPVKAPPFVASVKHPNRQRRTNHDRCYRLSANPHPQTATVHAPRPSSYHCLSLGTSATPPPQEV